MERTEKVELTVLCLLYKDDKYLLQDRVKNDWKGFTLPGGHIEIGESIVDAIIREMKEETGLTVVNPKLCGVKQFPIKDGKYEKGRYLVFLFKANACRRVKNLGAKRATVLSDQEFYYRIGFKCSSEVFCWVKSV